MIPSKRLDLDRAAVVRVRQADVAPRPDERPETRRRVEVLGAERVPRQEPTVFLVKSCFLICMNVLSILKADFC